PWTAAHEKLITAFVGREMPDVAQMGTTWIPEMAALGAVEPLDARVAASAAVDREDYFPGIWETNVLDGVLYGVPWYVDTRLVFYRKDLLAAAGVPEMPRTWSAWRAAMEAVGRKGGPGRYGLLLPTNEWAQPVTLAVAAGAELLSDGGRHGAFRAPEFRRAAEFFVGLYRDGLAPPLANSQVANLYQQMAAGEFAMYVTGPWNLGEFRRRLPATLQDAWATAPLPAPDGLPWPGLSLAGGSSLVVFRSSEKKDAAWKVVEFLSEPATQKRFWALCGDLPARRSAWDEPALAGDARTASFRLQLEHVRATPKVPEWEQIAAKVWERLEPVARGAKGLEASLAALDADVDAILEKRRWLLDRKAALQTPAEAPR
ncbi:MAG: sugar ABC transporter substrate-binding protein, partial [Thermoanaerobaculia bacterium]|nr:sugar ABC transporter substrate-binding protein [Thermoanaerobaculia bacterium]